MGITDTVKWRAVYNDGTYLDEIDTNGQEHAFKEIQTDKIKLFQLINQQNIPVCQVKLGDEKRLIWARRRRMMTGQRIIMQGDAKVPIPTTGQYTVIILGWQKTVNGTNIKSIFYLLPDGRIEMDDEWREEENTLYSPVNTPGTIQEPEKKSLPSTTGKIKETIKGETFSESNDSAFKDKQR